jgi:hypothetical protein
LGIQSKWDALLLVETTAGAASNHQSMEQLYVVLLPSRKACCGNKIVAKI